MKTRDLLKSAQDDFPLEPRPFRALGEKAGMEEDEVLSLLREEKNAGRLKRIAASFDKGRFGYVSTLVGLEVRPERLDAAARHVGRFPEVTHCYERTTEMNLWFTIIARTAARKEEILRGVADLPGVVRCLDCPAKRVFKIDARFQLRGDAE
jgi:DNA-binding Lrp family transcriptional regulator